MPETSNERHPRRIFSTSLCGMFENPRQSKTDFCALTCCGIWLWERNQYLLERTTPKAWRQRPLVTGLVILLIVTVVVWAVDPGSAFLRVAVVLLVTGFLLSFIEFQQARVIFRRKLALQVLQRDSVLDEEGDQEVEHNAQHHDDYHQGDIQSLQSAHAICGCVSANSDDELKQERLLDGDSGMGTGEDLCTRIWRLLSSHCCEMCCQCWCQCCGMCAIAQEHRHLQKLLPSTPDLWERDYITLQPWQEYFPKIIALRDSQETSLWAHLLALSTLSSRLVVGTGCFLIGVVVVTALPVQYARWQILILLGTLLQPIVFLFFVHWLWHRFDLSLDAVVKYFASGFFLCTSVSIVYETLISGVLALVTLVVNIVAAMVFISSGDVEILEGDDDDGNSERLAIKFPTAYLVLLQVVVAFLNAFVLAALVEEMCKYMCFWMVEHPDMADPTPDPQGTRATDIDAVEDGGRQTLAPPGETTALITHAVRNKANPVSRGAAVTIAMVATALGFACAENLLYVFVYTAPGVSAEVSTLILRSLLPVHPLAAAIQSIGVVARDVEHDSSYRLGRILFPAWLLHGLFDFVLMAYTAVVHVLAAQGEDDDNDSGAPADSVEEPTSSLGIVAVAITIPLVGAVYYMERAWAQRRRLKALDTTL